MADGSPASRRCNWEQPKTKARNWEQSVPWTRLAKNELVAGRAFPGTIRWVIRSREKIPSPWRKRALQLFAEVGPRGGSYRLPEHVYRSRVNCAVIRLIAVNPMCVAVFQMRSQHNGRAIGTNRASRTKTIGHVAIR